MRFVNGNNDISIFGEGMCTVPASVAGQCSGVGVGDTGLILWGA